MLDVITVQKPKAPSLCTVLYAQISLCEEVLIEFKLEVHVLKQILIELSLGSDGLHMMQPLA